MFEILDTLCSSVAKLHLAPGRTLSNRWLDERLRTLEKAATAILREPTRFITDTKGHHALRLEGQFEDYDEGEEEAVFLVVWFRRMKISVRNLDKIPRTCRRSTLRGTPSPHPLPVEAGGVQAQCGTGSLWGPLQPPGRGGASSDPSNVNHVDHKLGLPALYVLSPKSMYMSPRVALAFQKGVASTQMTIRNFGGTRPWGCCVVACNN